MRVGAIDVGTNSIHLLVADIGPDGHFTVVEKAREQVELGSGGLGAERIVDEAFERGLRALATFKGVCDSLDVQDIHAAATSAVREAENGVEFCVAVKKATGIHIRIISGTEEARLIYLGVRRHLDFSRGRVLIVDLGGGSTEFILCDPETALIPVSLPLGHIRLTDQFGDDIGALRKRVAAELKPLRTRIHSDDFARLVGTSGAIRCLARVATFERGVPRPRHGEGMVLRREEVDRILELTQELSLEQLIDVPGMDRNRVRTLPAAAVVVQEVMEAFAKPALVTSEHSLRDGLVADWVIRNRPEVSLAKVVRDPRRRAVLAVMARYGVDEDHARHTAELALRLFDATALVHRLRVDDRRLLEFAGLLHDVGHHIAGDDHHKHGQYLIRHTPMSGFTAPEIAVLANVVRYHRGREPRKGHDDYASLPPEDRRRVRVLAGILRIADGLDRGHNHNTAHLDVDVTDDEITLRVLTKEPGHLERWATVRRTDLLEEVLNRTVTVKVRSTADR